MRSEKHMIAVPGGVEKPYGCRYSMCGTTLSVLCGIGSRSDICTMGDCYKEKRSGNGLSHRRRACRRKMHDDDADLWLNMRRTADQGTKAQRRTARRNGNYCTCGECGLPKDDVGWFEFWCWPATPKTTASLSLFDAALFIFRRPLGEINSE